LYIRKPAIKLLDKYLKKKNPQNTLQTGLVREALQWPGPHITS